MSKAYMAWTAALVLGAGLIGCSGNRGPQVAPMAGWGEAGPDSVSGTVRQVGNLPFARTLVDGGGENQVFVSGELESEIARLAGMEVRVSGSHAEGDQPGRYIRATSYEILQGEEEAPVVGILRRDSQGYYLETFDGGSYRLSQVPPELEEQVSAKIWVAAAEGEHVRGYGILREASE